MSKNDILLGGEISSSGKDRIWIELDKKYPKVVHCSFSDKPKPPHPCNPHKHDKLEYDIKHKDGRFDLLIEWDVSDMRSIKWYVEY